MPVNLRWNNLVNLWEVIFDGETSFCCESYKEAWFFKKYEDQLDKDFVWDYFNNM